MTTIICGDKVPILCVQEHFLLRGNSYIVQKALPNSHIFFKSAVKENQNYGRAKNGMFVAVPDKFKERFNDVSPNHWRVQAVTFDSTLIISVYLPTDPGTMNYNDQELTETLGVIQNVLESNLASQVILTGDFNADFSRNTGHVNDVKTFIENAALKMSWSKFHVDFTHVTVRNDVTFTHTLDHFLWGEGTANDILEAGAIHHVENESDHCPIYCCFQMPASNITQVQSANQNPKPSWKKSSSEEKELFSQALQNKLEDVTVPNSLNCRNPSCDTHAHRADSDRYIEDVLNAISDSAGDSLSWSSGGKSGKTSVNKTPGWNEQVRPFRENARFWFSVWLSAGKPLNCELHRIMRRTKNIFHYQVKKCKKAEDQIRKQKLLSAVLDPDSDVDLFKEIKSMRKAKATSANKIDDQTEDIEEHFAGIYKELYNSIDDYDDLMDVAKILDSKISNKCAIEVEKVTPDIVKEAVKHIKPNKSDPVFDFTSDCLKNAPDSLFMHFSNIIKSFLIHGHVSVILLLSTLVPIIKDKLGNICSSKNYRSIAISSLFLKIFDWVVILLYGDCLQLHDLQFAYQPKCSTNMCTWLVVETIDYFLRKGGEVFACAMDMTKAFDLVVHSKLLMKLLDASMPAIMVRLMLVMYLTQFANVRWCGAFSGVFNLRNGCKQGAVLSAIAYCVYVNGLFEELKKNRSGCWIGTSFLGLLGYSDDNFLLAPSREALQAMLSICERYANGHGLKFSTDPDPKKSKTRCLAFLKNERVVRPVVLCGNQLPWVKSCKHLGNTIVTAPGGDIRNQDIKNKRAAFIDKNNDIIQEFNFAHPKTRAEINRIENSHFYGSVLWNLASKEAISLEKSWNVSIRMMFNLPRESHCYLIEAISNQDHVRTLLARRFLSFIHTIRTSKKKVLRHLLRVVEFDTQSVTGRNLRSIILQTAVQDIRKLRPDDVKVKYSDVPRNEKYRVAFINEIIDVKNNQLEVNGFNDDEIEEILQHLCVS